MGGVGGAAAPESQREILIICSHPRRVGWGWLHRADAPWKLNGLTWKQRRARNTPYGPRNKVVNGTFIGVDFHLSSIV